ncbi:hypothetical protein [Zymomonas mobilis]|uniref:Uncharacterized protein n=1 Tax=Zymomonas mobilis subsp. pomaceae (strain ATCC 29192 / DSM 22645 / JCM 10191 / CCUG 17912 / NBRC 13757 / NCIMB 11200 / NRRL B-4491 / Barker I) TaxID=579138 RepID=F8ERR7_ZYMMT|nr:hypothetical protein [Zymomonas mobilis]AEI37525.1 hypothetical protein Zymop_0623 [Zymomonas mobilis subsp. pomaceae ATCC 29192]MDX5948893.1 hypothetical protein [Zymomonas mobilis subsp. pomaceae]GEB88700.1 hypothetical protein ZMO02_03370 [Zymomonas mobilis subsp. pomaceae]
MAVHYRRQWVFFLSFLILVGGIATDACFAQSHAASLSPYSVNALKHPIRIEKKEKIEKKEGFYPYSAATGLITRQKAGNLQAGWGDFSGRYLIALMQHVDTPLASRWAEITLRRALLLKVGTPKSVEAQAWVAARSELLLQLGEADAARALVQQSDILQQTGLSTSNNALLEATLHTILATADPAGLCPLLPLLHDNTDIKDINETLVKALCAGLSGEGALSSWLFSRANYKGDQTDRRLAQKIAIVGSHDDHSIHIGRNDIGHLTFWRYGMATAAGVVLPDYLYNGVNPAFASFMARAAMLPIKARLGAVRKAAVSGVFSNAALVDFYSSLTSNDSDHDANDTTISEDVPNLKQAYTDRYADNRVKAVESLIAAGNEADDHYAGMILTARAASYISPSSSYHTVIPHLVASMLSAGFDRAASRWASVVKAMPEEESDSSWILLAIGAPDPVVDFSRNRVRGFIERSSRNDPWRAQMAIAALAALKRINQEDSAWLQQHYDLSFSDHNGWIAALDRASLHHAPATVALLVAIGMQNRPWRMVAPSSFYHMLAAMENVGLDSEARMIAAEMMSRT